MHYKNRSSDDSTHPERATDQFFYDLWLTFESLQDEITDHNSREFQLLEFLNPILFNLWIRAGGR